jgi:hypothetical protein
MSKTIIHSKFPIDDFGRSLIPLNQVARYVENIQSILPNDCVLITTPFDTTKIDGDTIIINIDCKGYSYNELMDIIEKAQMYDGLCK